MYNVVVEQLLSPSPNTINRSRSSTTTCTTLSRFSRHQNPIPNAALPIASPYIPDMHQDNADFIARDELFTVVIIVVSPCSVFSPLRPLACKRVAAAGVRVDERVVLQVLVPVEALLGGPTLDELRRPVDRRADARHGARVEVREQHRQARAVLRARRPAGGSPALRWWAVGYPYITCIHISK